MPDHSLDPDLASLSAALSGLAPAPPALNRDRLLYEAGRRAPRPGARAWPVATALFAMLSAGLGVRLVATPTSPVVSVVYVTVPAPEGPPSPDALPDFKGALRQDGVAAAPGPATGYLRLRDLVVRFGADSLPAVPPARGSPQPPVEWMLDLPVGTLDDSQKSRWQHQLSRGDV